MANKNYGKKGLRALFFALVMLVGNFSFVACDNEDVERDGTAVTYSEVVKKDIKKDSFPEKEPELEYFVVPMHNAAGKELAIADTVGERTTNVWWLQQGKAKLSMKEYDYVTEMKFKHLNAAYSNTNKNIGEPEVSDTYGMKRYTTKCTFALEDGNLGTITADSYQRTEKVNGQSHTFEYAKLNSFDVVSLSNVENAKTRGEYIADSCYTEVMVNLHYIYENSNVPGFDVLLVDTIFRKFLAQDDIDYWEYDNVSRKVINTTTERCDFRKVGHMKSGEVKYLEKSIILQYGIWGIDEYELLVKSFAFGFNYTNGIKFGDTALERVEGYWKVSRRSFGYGSVFTTSQGDKIESKYTGYSESAVYDDGDVRVEFPMIDMKIAEGNTDVTNLNGDGYYDRARFNNRINADYQGYSQSVSESVILKKEAVRQTFEGWDESSAKKTITLWNVHTSIDYVVRSSDGSEQRTTYEMDFGWTFIKSSFWEVYAENNSYYTGAVNATVNGTQKSQNAKDGAVWNWNENTHAFVAEVLVANGTQYDKWQGKTVNDITIARNGNVYNFGHDDYSMTDNGTKLGNAASSDSEDVYPYAHSLNFGYAGTTADATAEGKIHVAKVVVPDTFFGKLKGMTFIVANNAEHTDYLYTALAHLEGGEVIPGVWNRNGEIQWHPEWKQQSDATNLNGAVYEHSTGKWVPVHAWDSPDCLQYDTPAGANADNQGYDVAIKWNWDEGRLVNGHASVTTERISYTMNNGVVSATDTYTGNSLGSWTYQQ